MPYIKEDGRLELEHIVKEFYSYHLDHGDVNYLITQLCLSTQPVNYADYNALVGSLECAKLEFYRRAVAAYEDEKIKENGDIYPK